jgi:hypothetical protein
MGEFCMTANKRLSLLLCLVLFVPAALSQSPRARGDRQEFQAPPGAALEEPPAARDRRGYDEPPPAGFWPTNRMMYLFIDRLTEDLSKSYGFTDDQLQQTRELWKDEFPIWLNEHRADIQQLTNEYLEALLDNKPPDPEYVADWAQRVLPLVDEFADRCEVVGEQMRPFLSEEQQLTLDGQLAGFRVGMKYLNQRLGGWAEGGFDAAFDWHRSPGFKEREKERNEQIHQEAEQAQAAARGEVLPPSGEAGGAGAQEAVKPAVTSKPAADDWGKYVEDFIRRYQLNAEQQEMAHKHLRVIQERRDGFLRRNASDFERAQRAASAAKSDGQRTRAEEQLRRLNRPLENMFTQLKEKLETIPTRRQRAEAADNGKADAHDAAKARDAAAAAPKP